MKEGFVTEEAFEYFEHAWDEYKTLAGVTTAVKQHLSSCLGEEVTTMIHATYGTAGGCWRCTSASPTQFKFLLEMFIRQYSQRKYGATSL